MNPDPVTSYAGLFLLFLSPALSEHKCRESSKENVDTNDLNMIGGEEQGFSLSPAFALAMCEHTLRQTSQGLLFEGAEKFQPPVSMEAADSLEREWGTGEVWSSLAPL